jgi:hypothetical protein
MLRIPNCLDNHLTDGGYVVSLMHQPFFNPPPKNLQVLISVRGWLNLRAKAQLEGLGKLKKIQ